MLEMIDRQAVLEAICEATKPFEENLLQDRFTRNGLAIARRIIVKQPTIEPEVRHGRWIHGDALDYKDPNGVIHVHGMCSRCRSIYDFRDMTSRFKFCPNCGAKMYADGGTISKERFAEIMRGDDNA